MELFLFRCTNSAMENNDLALDGGFGDDERSVFSDPPVQFDLLPFSPVPRRQSSSSSQLLAEGLSSSFQMGFGRNKRDLEVEMEGDCLKGSDDEDNCLTPKKLRLSKHQSAFLEESFKQNITLNPKQKLALSKQLNLRPRQVEVWFQNRRARTKLKQTEVDCEYLKRCCETLTEENRRLQNEVHDLRALKISQPYYKQLPATTLTMCPSCERVATSTTGGGGTAAANSKPRLFPFTNVQAHSHQAQARAH